MVIIPHGYRSAKRKKKTFPYVARNSTWTIITKHYDLSPRGKEGTRTLSLQSADEAFHRCIIVAVAHAVHADLDCDVR